MARKKLAELKDAVIEKAKTVFTDGAKVYPRVRYAEDFRDESIRKLYLDDSEMVNVWFIFLEERATSYDQMGTLLHVDYGFRLLGIVSFVDSEIDSRSSTAKVELFIENLADAFEADIELGLDDPSVSHAGLRIRITGGIQAAYQAHIIEGRLTVRAENC